VALAFALGDPSQLERTLRLVSSKAYVRRFHAGRGALASRLLVHGSGVLQELESLLRFTPVEREKRKAAQPVPL
jgi:hypothetical protein